MVDRLLDGKLEEHLRAERAKGVSYDLIALELNKRLDLAIGGGTVRRWCRRYIETERGAA